MASFENNDSQSRTYVRQESVAFRKTAEDFGGMSNMAPGYPLYVVGWHLRTSEALYQACRFPHLPHIQELIIDQTSPMTAKMKSKPYREHSRPDWDRVRIPIMRWCLLHKLAQNWRRFSHLLLSTGDRSIVEESFKDDFWGAIPEGPDLLVGKNVLGRLLMELRERLKVRLEISGICVKAPPIPDFQLVGRQIGDINIRLDDASDLSRPEEALTKDEASEVNGAIGPDSQVSLFKPTIS